MVAFWNTVTDCLVEFFSLEREQAAAMVRSLLARLADDSASKSERNLIYHSEPIHIASDLVAREPVRDAGFDEKYRRIQDRNLKRREPDAFPAFEIGLLLGRKEMDRLRINSTDEAVGQVGQPLENPVASAP
jgi:hypothetical protein